MSKSTWLSGLVVAGAMAWGLGTAAADPIRIGIANFGEHPQLNASIAGFKKALAELAVEKLTPVNTEMKRLLKAPDEIDAILRDGAERARALAAPIIRDVKDIVGFVR